MSKNVYLSLAFALLSCSPLISSAQTPEMSAALISVAQAKNDIMLEVKTALILKEKAEKHFSSLLQDQYEATKKSCLQALAIITSSPEYALTIEQITDAQAELITKDMVNYNDIIIDPSAFPLEQKVQDVLALAAFDETTEQLFNVFYVVFAITQGSKILLGKLERIKNVCDPLESVQAIDQAHHA